MPSRIPNFRFIANEDGGVILDIERDTICALNATGAFVWQELQRGKPLDAIVATLLRDTGEDFLVVERDVRAFLEQIEQRHLLPR
jgi:hypothetical protein